MRSDRDKRTDTEKEIDKFLSQFETPSDDISESINAYLDDSDLATDSDKTSFNWKTVQPDELKVLADDSISDSSEYEIKSKSFDASKEEEPQSHKTGSRRNRNRNKKKSRKSASSPASASASATSEVKKEPAKDTSGSDTQSKNTEKGNSGSKANRSNRSDRTRKSSDSKNEKPSKSGTERKEKHGKHAKEDKPKVSNKPEDANKPEVVKKKDETSAVVKVERKKRRNRDFRDIQTVKAADNTPKKKVSDAKAELPLANRFKRDKKDAKARKAAKESKAKIEKLYKMGVKDSKIAKAIEKSKNSDQSVKERLFLKENPDYDPSKGETYEKDGKTVKNTKYKVSGLKILRDVVAVGCLFVLIGVIYALGVIIAAPKYDYKDIYSAVDTASVIYDDQGKQVDNVFYTENRKIVKYDDMPEDLINSFVAIEDKTFWKHHGFNWTRMIGAVISSLTGNGRISGTSTITQQLARNVYLSDTKSVRSIKRKLLEMYYASRLEHNLSKEQIIEAYLNTIYLGHGCYGVNAAADTYFSKKVKDLELIECASLAALPQSPDTYALLKLGSEASDAVDSKTVSTEPETIVTNDISRDRRQLTLDLMLDQDMISMEEYDKVYDLSLNDFIKPSISNKGSAYSYFHEYLVDTIINDLVEQRNMDYEDAERMVYTKGLQIYSTLDSTAQKVIVDEFQDESNFPYVSAPLDGDGNMLNSEGDISLYKYANDFDENGDFTLSGESGDVRINSDGSVTIMKGKKLHIYETQVEDGTDYSLEFKPYYLYDDNDILYSISGGFVNVPMGYKTMDTDGNVTISADFFNDPTYSNNMRIEGKDLIITKDGYALNAKSRQPQAAMTIVEVGTGEVKAMVGGRTSGGQKLLNRSLNARQPGSSIKPLAVYGAALQKSFDLAQAGKKWKFTDFKIDKQGTKGWGDYVTTYSSIEDEKTHIEGRDWPKNFNNSYSGENTFKTAIQQSINTCAVKLELQIGDDYSLNQLKKFGLTTVQDDTSQAVNDANPAALALGAMTNGVTPLEMALAYSAFPAGGKVNTPMCYYKVLDRNGEMLLEGKSEQSEALDEGVAWIMTDVLQGVVSANKYLYVEGVNCGGKTGTTNDQYDIWFDGFTPNYVGSIWIGTDENVEMSSMSRPAATLWGVIMNQIPNAKTGSYKEQPANVISKSGCYFTKGTETGLTKWSDKAEKEARRKAAYNKWLKEREKHKVLVPAQMGEVDDPSKPIMGIVGYQKVPQIDPNTGQPVIDPNTGQPVMVDDPNNPIMGVIGYEKMQAVIVPEHWEYEEGWRDGDFKYKE